MFILQTYSLLTRDQAEAEGRGPHLDQPVDEESVEHGAMYPSPGPCIDCIKCLLMVPCIPALDHVVTVSSVC